MTYAEKLKDPRWQKKRLGILDRDQFTCQKCGDKETTLHIHHIKYQAGKEPWDYDKNYLVTLCCHCHEVIERFLKREDFSTISIKKHIRYFGNPGYCVFFKFRWDGPREGMLAGNVAIFDLDNRFLDVLMFHFEEFDFFNSNLY